MFGEEDVEQHRSHDGAQSGTGAKGDALSESDSKVTHGESEGKASDTPKHTEEHGHRDVERIVGREQLAKGVPARHGEQGTSQW